MAGLFNGSPIRSVGHLAISSGSTFNTLPCVDTFTDRGTQLQTTEGVPDLAVDQNKWLLPWVSLAAETPVWQSKYPDLVLRREMLLEPASARPLSPEPPLGWGARLPEDPAQRWWPEAPAAARPLGPDHPLGWGAVYPEPPARQWYPDPMIANPYVVTVYTGDQAVPIHVPDEVPIDKLLTIQVEHNAGGVAVPFDVPPSLRVYHLTAAGVQVIDLAYGVCTQYGANPSYFRNWTPTAKGKFIVEVVGLYLGNVVDAVQTLTVRPNIDPFALADSNLLVMRNGDVE